MDVTNPGLTSVANETYGNPDPNGGTARWMPRELDALVAAADQGRPLPPDGGVDASVFPTPIDVLITELVGLLPVSATFPQIADEVFVDEQSIGQGSMQPVTPGNPADGFNFVGPADFVVVGPAESFQTNAVDEIDTFTITNVLDADTLGAPTPSTTRYYLVLATPPALTSFPVSMLGRQITFSADTLTAADQGASRLIQNYGANFITIARDDTTASNGDVPSLTTPQVGDTFELAVNRQGSEQVNTEGGTVDVFILPPPVEGIAPVTSPENFLGNVDVWAVPQPGTPFIGSGVAIPNTRDVSVPDECAVVGLPQNVFA